MELIKIAVQGFDVDEVAAGLRQATAGQGVDISPMRGGETFMDPTVAVALVAGGASVLSALVTAALAYLQMRGSGTVEIQGRYGGKIVVPRDTTKAQLDAYIEAARKLDADHILIARD